MATKGKLEGQITFATAQTATVAGVTATIAAGTYYWSSALDLATAIAAAFSTAAGFAISVSTTQHGEGGTGVVTMSAGSAFTVAWISTDLRDLMGYTGNLSSATSHVAPRACRALWIPTCPKWATTGNKSFKGRPIVGFHQVENDAGYVWTHTSQISLEYAVRWEAIPKARIWIAEETTVNQSWERFWRDNIAGKAGWCAGPAKVRFYPDAADDATYGTYTIMDKGSCDPQSLHPQWDGLYTVDIPRMKGLDQ